MKIFISHKKEDEVIALEVLRTLKSIETDAYLDVLDSTIADNGEKLTRHIKEKMSECTDVIVILSSNTKKSQWVPFEIGMATEKDMPIANYLVSYEKLPEFLEYWPRLKNQQDVRKYVEVRNRVSAQIRYEKLLNEGYSQRIINSKAETQRFYAEWRKAI